ncbi:porin family protein [Flavobacteriales bacterium]|nr:porin family protein [Flavobacteriales bacterium]
MRISICFCICFNCLLACIAQEKSERYVETGLLRATSNLAIGFPTTSKGTNAYLSADMDYHVSNNISIRGEVYGFLSAFDTDIRFVHKHSGYLGLSYHITTSNHFDPYLGIQPGFVFSKLNPSNPGEELAITASSFPLSVNTLVAFHGGFNYYANRFFNFYAHVKYEIGKHHSDITAIPISEVKVAFGLSYMLWVRKDHFGFRKPVPIEE